MPITDHYRRYRRPEMIEHVVPLQLLQALQTGLSGWPPVYSVRTVLSSHGCTEAAVLVAVPIAQQQSAVEMASFIAFLDQTVR